MSNITALLVGVCEYPANGYKSLPLCANDVEAVKMALISGLNASETKIRVCGQNGIVTTNDLITGLESSIAGSANDDTFIFYFSGHGGNNILALSDNNLNLQSLIDFIEKIPVNNKIIVLDSCHSGDFAISDTPDIDLSETIETFVGHGYAVLASCGAGQTSGFESSRQLSTYTSFLVDALTSRFSIREGKKSLEAINEAIMHFAKMWNAKHPSQIQTPIFRSNIGGTIFFVVEEYKPYCVASVYEETDTYIIYAVDPVHTGLAKRLSAKIILRYHSSFEEIANIANEVKNKLKFADVYQNHQSESRFRGKPANIIWCYFAYCEEDIIDCNYIGHSTWIDDTQDRKQWYREKKYSQVINGVYFEINPSYELLSQMLHKEEVSRESLIDETHTITEKLVNAAQRYIKLYREYRNGVFSEGELIDTVEPLNREIASLYFQQSDLAYPPKELHEWADMHTQLAGTIHDFSLFYNKKNLNVWSTENRIQLMNTAIKRYETDLEALRALEKIINDDVSCDFQ